MVHIKSFVVVVVNSALKLGFWNPLVAVFDMHVRSGQIAVDLHVGSGQIAFDLHVANHVAQNLTFFTQTTN